MCTNEHVVALLNLDIKPKLDTMIESDEQASFQAVFPLSTKIGKRQTYIKTLGNQLLVNE